MSPLPKYNENKFCSPATYEFRVEGKASDSFLDIYDSISVLIEKGESGKFITTITAQVRDQAQLVGMLTSFYDWHFTILSLERLEETVEGPDSCWF